MSANVGERIEVESRPILGQHIIPAATIDGADSFFPYGLTRVAITPEGDTFTVIAAEARRMKLSLT